MVRGHLLPRGPIRPRAARVLIKMFRAPAHLDLQRSGFSPWAIQWLWDKGHASLAEVFARFNRELRKNACVRLLRILGFLCLRGAALLAATGLVWMITQSTR